MLNKNKEEMINKVLDAIQVEAVFLRDNKTISLEEKSEKMDVLLDIHHFLRDYEKNIKILNDYNAQHKFDREK